MLLNGNKILDHKQEFLSYVDRRKTGEPLQYIIGQWDFMGQTLKTDPRALIPRPETELLVELALQTLTKPAKVLDVCTGSGCIAIAMAAAGHQVTAIDISHQALSLAMENGAGLDIKFIQSDLFENVTGTFDLIISNPPYITAQEMEALAPTVAEYEPHLALYGGQDGMDIYRKLIPQSLNYLNPGGALFLEIGPAQVKDIMAGEGFTNVILQKDYAGLPRIVYGIKENNNV